MEVCISPALDEPRLTIQNPIRLVRAHWDHVRMEAIKEAYKKRTKKNLDARVASETSGSYKKLVVALVTK